MTRRYHANNFFTTLSSSITPSATTITVASVTGLPTITAGETYRLTISSNNTREIVIVTSRSSTTLTVTRAAESTTALAFPAGSVVEMRATADSFDRKADAVSTSGDVINFGDATSLEIPNNATATFTAEGQIALDTSVTDYADGVLCYRAGSTDYGTIAIPKAGLASPVDGYAVTYNATDDQFQLTSTLTNVVDDTSPQLGGDLDVNGYFIISASDGDIAITPDGTGDLILDGLKWPQADGTANYVLKTDGLGQLSWVNATSVGGDVVGPGSSTDNAIARYDGTTGKLLQNSSGVTIDDNNNIVSNNTSPSYTTTATAAGTTTLTVASTGIQRFTGTTTQTVVLPVTSTLTTGHTFRIINDSTGDVTVQSSGANTIRAVLAGTVADFTCILTSGTTAASWRYSGQTQGNSGITMASDDKILILDTSNNNALSYTPFSSITVVGNIASGTWNGTTIGVTKGGTGLTSATQGDIIYASAADTWAKLAKNTSSTRYLSNTGSSNNPAWAQIDLTNGVTGVLPNANGGGMVWNTASGTTLSAAVGNGYVCTNASQNTVTLPATAAVGDRVALVSQGAGGWKLTANTGQTIKGLNDTTTSAGNIVHANQYDTIEVICVVANTTWVINHFVSALLTFA